MINRRVAQIGGGLMPAREATHLNSRGTAALLVVLVCAAIGAATARGEMTLRKQRVTIEVTVRLFGAGAASNGTFRLAPLVPGPLQFDRGRFDSVGGTYGSGLRDGQRYQIVRGTDTFTGRAGKLVVRRDERTVGGGGGFVVGTGTWKVVRGTGPYTRVTGGGRLGVAFLTNGSSPLHARYEGYLTSG
jgi:hypothetical protein